jgi:hypothetical protein
MCLCYFPGSRLYVSLIGHPLRLTCLDGIILSKPDGIQLERVASRMVHRRAQESAKKKKKKTLYKMRRTMRGAVNIKAGMNSGNM